MHQVVNFPDFICGDRQKYVKDWIFRKIKSGHFRHLEQYPLSDRERYCTSRTLKDAPFRESKTEAGKCPGRHRKNASFLTWKKT